jgi:hypothetical protein
LCLHTRAAYIHTYTQRTWIQTNSHTYMQLKHTRYAYRAWTIELYSFPHFFASGFCIMRRCRQAQHLSFRSLPRLLGWLGNTPYAVLLDRRKLVHACRRRCN